MKRNVIIFSVMAILLVICSTALIKDNYEWVEEEVMQRSSPEAYRYQYLAARRYLDELDIYYEDIDSSEFFYDLPPVSDTILLRRLQTDLTDTAYSNLLAWVDNGGHLVFGLPYRFSYSNNIEFYESDNNSDRFLDQLNISPVSSDEEDEDNADDRNYEERWNVQSLTGKIEISAKFRDFGFLLSPEVAPQMWAAQDEGFVYAQAPYGSGLVIVLSVPQIWSNGQIGEADNALLLIHTLKDQSEYSTVYISDRNTDLPGIFSLIVNTVPWLCVALVVLGLAVLRRSSVRFGPVLTSTKPQSANFARFLYSKAQFHERNISSTKLLASVRARVRHQYRVNDDSPESEQELVQRMASTAKLPNKEIYRAIFEEKAAAKASLVEIIRTLQLVSRARNKRVK